MTCRHAGALLLAALTALLSSCSTHGLSLMVDDRLTFDAPEDGQALALPVTIEWRIEHFEVTRTPDPAEERGARGYFAVIVDRSPQPPGEPVTWFARDDETCRRDPSCPDATYLATRGVHTTADMSFTIDVLPRPADENRREMHEVTVVLLDPDGARIGESAWRVRFEIDRGTP